jgi:hypothetical protein
MLDCSGEMRCFENLDQIEDFLVKRKKRRALDNPLECPSSNCGTYSTTAQSRRPERLSKKPLILLQSAPSTAPEL